MIGPRTLNRRCAGCIYGKHADKTEQKLSDLNLNPGDYHGCHRDEKTRGSNVVRVCRGFLDQHPLGKHITVAGLDDADAVDVAWEHAIYEQHRRELVNMARQVAQLVRDGAKSVTVRIDGEHASSVTLDVANL